MFGAMIRAAEHWRSIRTTEFERRQMAAVRKELDELYEAENRPQRRHPNPNYPARLGLDLSNIPENIFKYMKSLLQIT
jgi:hypothetical protein